MKTHATIPGLPAGIDTPDDPHVDEPPSQTQTSAFLERARRARADEMELTPAEERALAFEKAAAVRLQERHAEDTQVRNTAIAAHTADLAEARAAHHKTSWQLEEARRGETAARAALTNFDNEHAVRQEHAHEGLQAAQRSAEQAFRERVLSGRKGLAESAKVGVIAPLTDLAALYIAARDPEFTRTVAAILDEHDPKRSDLSSLTDEEYAAVREPLKTACDEAKAAVASAQDAKTITATRLSNLQLNLV